MSDMKVIGFPQTTGTSFSPELEKARKNMEEANAKVDKAIAELKSLIEESRDV